MHHKELSVLREIGDRRLGWLGRTVSRLEATLFEHSPKLLCLVVHGLEPQRGTIGAIASLVELRWSDVQLGGLVLVRVRLSLLEMRGYVS